MSSGKMAQEKLTPSMVLSKLYKSLGIDILIYFSIQAHATFTAHFQLTSYLLRAGRQGVKPARRFGG